MHYILELLLAVMANVAAYCICKWLDGKYNDHS